MRTATARLAPTWRGLSTRELAALACASILFAALRAVPNVMRGMPGHTGLLWLPPLFLAAAAVRRVGAPTLVALTGSLLALPFSTPGALTLPSAVAAGLSLDLMGWGRDRLSRLPWALAAGLVAHVAKFAVHSALALVFAVEADSVRRGLGYVLSMHVAFGLGGGLLGWLLLTGARRTPLLPPREDGDLPPER